MEGSFEESIETIRGYLRKLETFVDIEDDEPEAGSADGMTRRECLRFTARLLQREIVKFTDAIENSDPVSPINIATILALCDSIAESNPECPVLLNMVTGARNRFSRLEQMAGLIHLSFSSHTDYFEFYPHDEPESELPGTATQQPSSTSKKYEVSSRADQFGKLIFNIRNALAEFVESYLPEANTMSRHDMAALLLFHGLPIERLLRGPTIPEAGIREDGAGPADANPIEQIFNLHDEEIKSYLQGLIDAELVTKQQVVDYLYCLAFHYPDRSPIMRVAMDFMPAGLRRLFLTYLNSSTQGLLESYCDEGKFNGPRYFSVCYKGATGDDRTTLLGYLEYIRDIAEFYVESQLDGRQQVLLRDQMFRDVCAGWQAAIDWRSGEPRFNLRVINRLRIAGNAMLRRMNSAFNLDADRKEAVKQWIERYRLAQRERHRFDEPNPVGGLGVSFSELDTLRETYTSGINQITGAMDADYRDRVVASTVPSDTSGSARVRLAELPIPAHFHPLILVREQTSRSDREDGVADSSVTIPLPPVPDSVARRGSAPTTVFHHRQEEAPNQSPQVSVPVVSEHRKRPWWQKFCCCCCFGDRSKAGASVVPIDDRQRRYEVSDHPSHSCESAR